MQGIITLPSSSTFWIAVFGAVTGALGLLLNFLSYRRTASHLKVQLLEGANSFYRVRRGKDPYPFLEGYDTEAFAIIGIELINKSDKPISIRSIRGIAKGAQFPLRHDPNLGVNHELLTLPIEDDRNVEYRIREAFSYPIRLEAYETTVGSIRFPFLNGIYNDKLEEIPITVVFDTSRRTYRLQVRLTELTQLHQHAYPQHTDKAD